MAECTVRSQIPGSMGNGDAGGGWLRRAVKGNITVIVRLFVGSLPDLGRKGKI